MGSLALSVPLLVPPLFRIDTIQNKLTGIGRERICCGVIFRGPHGEALIYPKLLRPCHCRRNGDSAKRFMSLEDGSSFRPNATNTATHVACSTGRNQFPNGISA
ncbi:hypothetical protein AVEN_246178-1 [Araneus ventricosus]|uniref:Uncharacterized protein n=1 Tax=Araneus ventricosus TaxID=182803 RepID=A0A4Y2J5D9_ARAVE|nr:hypothetical protein AVEN_246178-1 [Araneus ventricosus]